MDSIKVVPAKPLDERWYRQLKPFIEQIGETFVALEPSREYILQARRGFIESHMQSAPLLYPDKVNTASLIDARIRLERLYEHIDADEMVNEIRDLYSKRIKELIANIDMIIAAANGNKNEFKKANEFIYGVPNHEIFSAACQWIRQDIVGAGSKVSMELRDELLRLLPDMHGDYQLLPNDIEFQKVRQFHFSPAGYVSQLFEKSTIPDEAITTKIGDPIARQAIRNVGSDFDLVDSPSGLWAVLQTKRQVIRPSNLMLDKQAFMGIVSHEIGSHLLESTNGAVSALKLLELGLDRYEAGNEGRAFLREQIMHEHIDDYINQPDWFPTKASWEYRVAIHCAISLAMGVSGRVYNFAEVYHVLILLFRFWTAKRGQKSDATIIEDGAWSMAVRVFKGSDGYGSAYLKDIVYLEGNIRCWEIAKQRPELILYGDKGKFDIANATHINALQKLGIIPNEY